MRQTISNIPENTMKTAKRILITILCCIPFVVVFAYLTRNVITNNALQITCFVIIFGVSVLVVELLHAKMEKQRERKRFLSNNKDIFK